MDKSKKEKSSFKSKILMFIIIAFAVAPLLINVGLVITDIIYEKTGFTLTAYGLSNVEWLDFWKQYLTIAISFLGIYLVFISANKDRQKHLQEKNAQQYLEEVRQEENVLVEVTQSFNMGVVYNALLQQAESNIFEGRQILADSRSHMDYAHIKFELLTDLCDDFKKCEKCIFSPCVDKSIMFELRDLFYDMEKHYFDMIEAGEIFLERLNQEQDRIKLLDMENSLHSNTNCLIDLYKSQGLVEEVAASKMELERIKERIKNLEKSKLELAEKKRFIEIIQNEKDYMKKMRPKFIRYCKEYINIKKNHAKDLRTVGYIKYSKVDEKNNS